MVLYGPSPVTATAAAVVKNVACKILGIPASRVLVRPKCKATPNRISFNLTHPSLPTDKSIVELRQEIDKEVNRMIRADIPIEVYHNMTLQEMLNKFGGDVIDRYYDINESQFAKWLFNEYELIMNKPIWTNYLEKRGPFAMWKKYQNIEGIQIDNKESIKQFLNEINGKEMDLLSERHRKWYIRRRNWLRHTGQIPNDESEYPEDKDEMELVGNKQWTHKLGVFDRVFDTDYSKAHEQLKFSAFNIDTIGCGLCLPNHYSRHWNSDNIQNPINYLKSTGELGKIVIYGLKCPPKFLHTVKFAVDVFPGYNSQIIGPNPYIMFRETFNIKHLASIIPPDHELPIPQLATPIDFKQLQLDDHDHDTPQTQQIEQM